jgi:hypothetical protein
MSRCGATRAVALLAAAWLSGCSLMSVKIQPRALGMPETFSPDTLIIAGVDSGSAAFMAHAGSTPRGYDGIAAYGPTARALSVMRSVEHDYGLREVSGWPIEPLHMHCAVLETPPGADRAALLAKLSQDRRIRLVQPLQTFAARTGGAYNDPYVDLQRGFWQMDIAGAHRWTQGRGVRVALIDTGVDIEHKDLRGNIASAANFVDADAGQFVRDRHGTELAGIIAAVANNREGIVGEAPAARLQVYKACWQLEADADSARCNSFTIARALAAAFDAQAQVVNLSIAGPKDPLLEDLIREGLRRGIVFIGAASPGLVHQSGVIEVASAEASEAAPAMLYAPGREILTLLPGNRYDFASGYSVATAEVTGVASLLLAMNPRLTPAGVYQILRDSSALRPNSAAPLPVAASDTASPGERLQVDACAAVIALLGHGSCGQAIGFQVGRFAPLSRGNGETDKQ